MANDIVGAPEIVLVKGRVFHFSPLNDLEYATLFAWVKWREEAEEDALSTVAGAVQLLYISVKRTDNLSFDECVEFIDTEDAANEVVEGYYKLNAFPDSDGDVADGKSLSKAEVYEYLSERYGWTIDQCRLTTPIQQHLYISIINNKPIQFNSEAEYRAWQARNRK